MTDTLRDRLGALPTEGIPGMLAAAIVLAEMGEIPAKATVSRWRAALAAQPAPAVMGEDAVVKIRLVCRFCGKEAGEGEWVGIHGCSKCNPATFNSAHSLNKPPKCPTHNEEMMLGFYDRPGSPPGNGWVCVSCSKGRTAAAESREEPRGGPFHPILDQLKDTVWIVEQNGRVHSVHATRQSAMNEKGNNLRIGARGEFWGSRGNRQRERD